MNKFSFDLLIFLTPVTKTDTPFDHINKHIDSVLMINRKLILNGKSKMSTVQRVITENHRIRKTPDFVFLFF